MPAAEVESGPHDTHRVVIARVWGRGEAGGGEGSIGVMCDVCGSCPNRPPHVRVKSPESQMSTPLPGRCQQKDKPKLQRPV